MLVDAACTWEFKKRIIKRGHYEILVSGGSHSKQRRGKHKEDKCESNRDFKRGEMSPWMEFHGRGNGCNTVQLPRQ